MLLVIAVPLSAQAGLLSRIFSPEVEVVTQTEVVSESALDVALLTSLQNPNPLAARGGADIVVNEDTLISTGPVAENLIAENKTHTGEIRVYTVREGDSLSQVAEMFGVTTNTIMWANDIAKATSVQPGDTLVILPIAGVRHVVKTGDTLSTIAKKYDGDMEEILAFNQLSADTELVAGDTVIIPGGEITMAAPKATAARPVSSTGATLSVSGYFVHPAPGSVRTQGVHGYNGVDFGGGYGSNIRAAAAGEVIVSKASGWNGGYGQYVVVKHANGTQTLYAHLSANYVGVGAYVSQGEVIGAMGSTGKSTGVHLHFEVRGAANPF